MLHARSLALPQQRLGGEGRGAEELLETRLMEMGGSNVNGWLDQGHCSTALAVSASSNDRESLLQLSLKSPCRIVKTLSASQLICSHLYQLPTPAPNFCLSLWVSIPFVITFPAGVLKWTRGAADGNTSLQHPQQPGAVTHTPRPWQQMSPPSAQPVMVPPK